MRVRGIRGATLLAADDADEMGEAVGELLREMMRRNDLDGDALVSIVFTSTPDLHCAFPAAAARSLGLTDVPLLCAQEIDVTGAVPRAVRILMHAETARARAEVEHVYMRGAEVLRQDLVR